MGPIDSVFIDLAEKARPIRRVFLKIYQSILLLEIKKENVFYRERFH